MPSVFINESCTFNRPRPNKSTWQALLERHLLVGQSLNLIGPVYGLDQADVYTVQRCAPRSMTSFCPLTQHTSLHSIRYQTSCSVWTVRKHGVRNERRNWHLQVLHRRWAPWQWNRLMQLMEVCIYRMMLYIIQTSMCNYIRPISLVALLNDRWMSTKHKAVWTTVAKLQIQWTFLYLDILGNYSPTHYWWTSNPCSTTGMSPAS